MTTLLLWGSGDPGICSAQERTALGVTAGLSSQSQGDSDQPYLGPGFGGTSVAGLLLVDADVAGRVSVGGEASLGSNINGHQQQRTSGGTNRFHLLKDDDRDESGVVRRGVASTIFRFGGGARFRF